MSGENEESSREMLGEVWNALLTHQRAASTLASVRENVNLKSTLKLAKLSPMACRAPFSNGPGGCGAIGDDKHYEPRIGR